MVATNFVAVNKSRICRGLNPSGRRSPAAARALGRHGSGGCGRARARPGGTRMSVQDAASGATARLPLTFACGLYDRMLRLYTGEVAPAGIDLEFLANDQPRDIFDRMGGRLEFDASEM